MPAIPETSDTHSASFVILNVVISDRIGELPFVGSYELGAHERVCVSESTGKLIFHRLPMHFSDDVLMTSR
ncbi:MULTISPECIES: hypothetical protein [Chromohalobacter]|uniref:Uncharacterized protein n=1 Tax=Chromohalobacter canadensis TaxID=141389 RepID=A0ABZ0YE56_9GAMM|nr:MULTISPECIES: hypothetical protein [Chromohalobacter]MCK0769585.1 hypothetical protein [Chromohalobacter canadensis]WQH10365.1 hypothetical protein SR908_06765 [Chromohalobacter canadensis]